MKKTKLGAAIGSNVVMTLGGVEISGAISMEPIKPNWSISKPSREGLIEDSLSFTLTGSKVEAISIATMAKLQDASDAMAQAQEAQYSKIESYLRVARMIVNRADYSGAVSAVRIKVLNKEITKRFESLYRDQAEREGFSFGFDRGAAGGDKTVKCYRVPDPQGGIKWMSQLA